MFYYLPLAEENQNRVKHEKSNMKTCYPEVKKCFS